MKIKVFKGFDQHHIQIWLNDHSNIEIVSTNLAANKYGFTYTILYKERN